MLLLLFNVFDIDDIGVVDVSVLDSLVVEVLLKILL